jgi:hypothetical protein
LCAAKLKRSFSVTAFFTNPVNNMPRQLGIDVVISESEEIDLARRKPAAPRDAASRKWLCLCESRYCPQHRLRSTNATCRRQTPVRHPHVKVEASGNGPQATYVATPIPQTPAQSR